MEKNRIIPPSCLSQTGAWLQAECSILYQVYRVTNPTTDAGLSTTPLKVECHQNTLQQQTGNQHELFTLINVNAHAFNLIEHYL